MSSSGVRESFFDFGGNYEFRRATFKKWPYQKEDSICHPILMSIEWWRCLGDSDVNCVICSKELEGWECTDDPYLEHKKHSPKCPVVAVHTFMKHFAENGDLDSLKNENTLRDIYVKWVQEVNCLVLPRADREKQPTKKGKGKKTAIKRGVAASVENIAVEMLSPDQKTQRKQPRRQVKTTALKASGLSAPNLTIKKDQRTMTYSGLVSNLEALVRRPESHLLKALLDHVKASGRIIND